jgi:hypothetical protein
VADHLRRAGSFAQQFDKLAVQNINLISQFFQRHFILVSANSYQLSAISSVSLLQAAAASPPPQPRLKAES